MMSGMAGKANGRTTRAYMRGVFAGTEGGERAAQLWALTGWELHGGPEWLVTLRGDLWLALGGPEADYARAHPDAGLEEIRAGGFDAGHARVHVGVGLGAGTMLLLGVLALPILLLTALFLVVGALFVGVFRLAVWFADRMED